MPELNSLGDLASERFKLGPRQVSVVELLGPKTLSKIEKKFVKDSASTLAISLRELLRFLFLSAHSPKTVFFPGDKLIDDLWHALITETASYRNLCHSLRPHSFIDHSGVPFDEYSSDMTPEEVHEEQFSWLASYVKNFGAIEATSFECLYLAQELCERLGSDRDGLNRFAEKLLSATQSLDEKPNFKNLLESIQSDSYLIDSEPSILGSYLKQLPDASLFTNEHLEDLFGASVALAFTYWQHIAACERL